MQAARRLREPGGGKGERFIQTMLREWAYALRYSRSPRRADELPLWTQHYNCHRRYLAAEDDPQLSGSASTRTTS